MGALTRIGEAWRALTTRPAVEASKATPALTPPTAKQVARAGFEFGIPLGGTSIGQQVASSQERIQILTQLHQAYLTCPWVSAPIDLIARTVTAGGVQLVTDDEVPDDTTPVEPPPMARLRRLLRFTNPHEDLVQLLRNVCTDLMLFGDAFIEIVYLLREPVALYMLDAASMTVICDAHGEVSGYRQDTDTGKSATFDLGQVIHISLDAPRGGIYGVAPAQKALLPTTAYLFTEACIKENFRRGDPESLHVDLAGYTDAEMQRWREQYMVYNLGPKAIGVPLVTKNNSQVQALNPRKVTDYLDTARQLRDEIITCFGVPPAKLGIIETGNIGSGSGESQDKTFRINTVIPLQTLVLEKLNYHLLQVGFGIVGWHMEFNEVDLRDSKVVEEIRDMRIRNGLYVLNRARDEIGEPPVDGGDEAVIIERENITRWRDVEAASQAGIASKLKGTALEPGEPKPGEAAAVEKPEPAPVPAPLAPFAGQPPPGQQPGGGGFPSKDRPGGPDDATQGKAPKETHIGEDRFGQDWQALSVAWQHAYRARRRQALEQLPTDPYWGVAHNHNDRPDYTPTDLGLPGAVFARVTVNPADVHTDHDYQRPLQPELVARYRSEPRQLLAGRVGLLARRPDGTLWIVDGQHHTAAAAAEGITAVTYQQFDSTGPEMEARVYAALQRWHLQHPHPDLPVPAARPRRRRKREPATTAGGGDR